ncbi:MAG TPA: hypothetical protein VFI31_24990 [Pirellulales bacterium]|nr:hypothetical protein [Pirellulales bacterium]
MTRHRLHRLILFVAAELLASHKRHPVVTRDAIKVLGQARDEPGLVVPVLTQIAAQGRPGYDFGDIAEAIDALGKLGRSAKAAVPALERSAFDEQDALVGSNDNVQKHARRAQRKIASADDEHPAERE